ncbi:hypothetical protein [Jhaorihella thermophila]|uniref:Uncharacterized protein n=1 Tax=Jhaorihella thermophila TaxID=488547 RepID=A0A1H5XY45_9RHOB|nr:hypothetical protein [Jhaorihella thermophila]SEG16357.1 hypothetical protein SAMN05421751_11343 [Jhaorihella thermophila]
MFEIMIWAGTAVTLLGLVGLIWCVIRANRVRRQNLADEDLKQALMALLPLNLGSLFLSAIGLMLVVVGIILS